MKASDKLFAGSIPALYDHYLGPLIFEPYADDLAARAGELRPGRVLETAAGTGVVTRALRRTLPAEVEIVATDLNPPMLDYAATVEALENVTWRQADAMVLPFPDASFDLVLCQFGAMFFPDKPVAYREARRVLRPGGTFLFNVWDRVEENHFTHVLTEAVAAQFPDDPSTLPRADAARPLGYVDHRARPRARGIRSRPYAKPSRGQAARPRHATRRWDSARERRCATRSRAAPPAGWTR